MKEIRFFLDIPSHRYLAYYQGAAQNISVTSVDGLRVRFPANVLRPHLTHYGIKGEFVLQYDDNNKFMGLRRVR